MLTSDTHNYNVMHCGASLSKQWREGEKSNNLVGHDFCTYVTGVGGACARGMGTAPISRSLSVLVLQQ